MKLKRSEKDLVVERLTDELKSAPTVYLTDFTGLSVKSVTDLRRRLRGAGVKYVVVKNTLAQRALAAADVKGLDPHLAGPTAFALSSDAVGTAKVLTEFAREFDKFTVKAALVDGRAMSADEVKRLATLPSREELLSQLAGAFQAPMAGFAGALNGLLYQMVGALEALREQRANNAA